MLVFMHYISTLCSVSLRSGLKKFIKLYSFFHFLYKYIKADVIFKSVYMPKILFEKENNGTNFILLFCIFINQILWREVVLLYVRRFYCTLWQLPFTEILQTLRESCKTYNGRRDQQNLQCHMTVRTLQCHVTIGANHGHVINKTCNIM